MRAEGTAKLLPSDGISFSTAKAERVPPIKCSSLQLSTSIQNLLLVITLCNLKLPLNCTQPVIGLEWVSGMFEDKWMSFQKLSPFVSDSRWCILVPIPHILHALSHLLKQLSLHHHQLLHSDRGCLWQVLASLVVPPGVHHL